VDAVVALPIFKKHILKWETFVQNNTLDTHIQAVGLPAPQMTIVCIGEYAHADHMREAVEDPTLKKLIGDAIADFGLESGTIFAVDAVTKIDKLH